MDKLDKVTQVIFIGIFVAKFLLKTSRVLKAIKLCKECLILLNNKALEKEQEFVRWVYIFVYCHMLDGYALINDHASAIECGRKLLDLLRQCDDRVPEGMVTIKLAILHACQSKYKEAKELYTKAISIMIETGEQQTEGKCYGRLGTVFYHVGEYFKAKEYLNKSLEISKEIGDKEEEAADYQNLATVFQSLGDYAKAKEYLQKALAISKEIGDKEGEAVGYQNLGTVFQSLGDYAKAKEYLQKALVNIKESGDKNGEATVYGNLGVVFYSVAEYDKAEEYLQKALELNKETGDRKGVATVHGNLGAVFRSLGDYAKAKEYHHKALVIRKEIGDLGGEAAAYVNLGVVFLSVDQYDKAKEYLQKALAISREIGDQHGEAASYGNLGDVFLSVGEYHNAKEYLMKALVIRKEIGDKNGEALDYGNLGSACQYLKEYSKAEQYYQKALAIRKEIGDKRGEAAVYGNLGSVFRSLGDHGKAEEYIQKELEIAKEIGDKKREAMSCSRLGTLFRSLGDYEKAREYHEKALVMSYEIGSIKLQLISHLNLTWNTLQLHGNISDDAVTNLILSIRKCEVMRVFLRDNDQFKITFLDEYASLYETLSVMFCVTGNIIQALEVVELGRARALADLMSTQYSVENEISVNLQSWVGMEKIKQKERNYTYLYISYFHQFLLLWILMPNKMIIFIRKDVNDCCSNKEAERTVEEIFGDETAKFNGLPQEYCEDRSLLPSIEAAHVPNELPQKDRLVSCRLIEEDEDEYQRLEPPSLAQCYQMIIAPVADFLQEPEIIIVPDRALYKVPFAALKDESEKYLSQTFRIRIVPSLTTLKLIQDSPADYHSQTGALIVGEPAVSQIHYKGYVEKLCPLPWAKKEAEMIGRLLGVAPLIGEHATKQAVLQSIQSVSLVHFAAHGNAETGEIALAPPRPTNKIPQEEDYLLTMAEISQAQLRAKLVVLSCCHSARGQIRSEGVVGIARAFLGSGVRSVLVALWAIQDKATEQFMSRFYEHLVRGESASESLHQAMKWMRGNGFSEVGQWAPFMLIGDNVTFDFGK